MKKSLPNVTLIAYDTVDADRASRVLIHCMKSFEFGDAVLCCAKEPTGFVPHRVLAGFAPGYAEAQRWEVEGIAEAVDPKSDFSLFVSHDGWILNPHYWDDEFLKWDFVGAPWPRHWGFVHRVGNSGFCLRSRRFLEASRAACGIWAGQPSDVFTCRTLALPFIEMGLKFAPVEIAGKFAWEHYQDDVDCGPGISFGFHGWVAGKMAARMTPLLSA